MTAAEAAADADGQALLTATRASYGGALLIAPGAAIYLATGRRAGRTARRIARLLGARHLIQAGVSTFAPLPGVLAAGAGADGLHAASMLILAAADRGMRRAALTDALAEALFAAAGLAAAGLSAARLPHRGHAFSCSILSRNRVVAMVALRGWPRRNA